MNSLRVQGATDLPSYMAASVTYSATAAATVVWEINNPATSDRLVRVHRFQFSATQTTGGLVSVWRLELASTSSTAGTSASVTAIKVDSSQVAAQAVVRNFTANPNAGVLTGIIWQPAVLVPAPASVVNPGTVIDFDTRDLLNGRPITLRRGEALRLNMGGGTIPSGLASCQAGAYWTEEKL